MDPNCLSNWFPRLLAAGVPVPKTVIIDVADVAGLMSILDGEMTATFSGLCEKIDAASVEVGGYPLFLRTGQGSGKHEWNRTCFVEKKEDIQSHVAALIEWSHLVDMMGLPHNVWCVREYLPVNPIATLYLGMPLVPEIRAFIGGGKILCAHPYWPTRSIREGIICSHTVSLDDEECEQCDARAEALAAKAGEFFSSQAWVPVVHDVANAFAGDGEWSVDVIATRRGMFVTDMANAAQSYHWEGCKFAAIARK